MAGWLSGWGGSWWLLLDAQKMHPYCAKKCEVANKSEQLGFRLIRTVVSVVCRCVAVIKLLQYAGSR